MNWKREIENAFDHAVDDSVVEELEQHATAMYAAARAEGVPAEQAQQRVRDQIGAWARDPLVRSRRPRHAPAVEPPASRTTGAIAIWQDARYAWRLIARQPAYAAVLVATLALGIAATTVLGSVAYGVLLKPLPWADAPRLIRLYETRQGSTRRFRPMLTNGTYREWRDHQSTIDGLGAWSTERLALIGRATSERITITEVTPSLFDLLHASPVVGRGFAADEAEPGHTPVVLLSYGFWQQQFGGQADAIGQTIRLDATTFTVIGVMAKSFAFPDRETRAWSPLYVEPPTTPGKEGYSISMFQAVARLRPGATPDQASAEGTARGRAVPNHGVTAMAVFGSNGPVEVTAIPLLASLTGDVRPAILILLVAVGLLLATATANAASLQLARATTRRRELAIRAALGAARGRLMRQTLVENVLLGLLGGAAGLALAAAMHRALPVILPAGFPRLDEVTFGWRVELFTAGTALIAGLGCGLLPAWHASRSDLIPALVEDSLAPSGGGLRTRVARTRAAIMTAQVAMACVLLIGALLLVRSFVGLMRADVGYDAGNVLTARVVLPDGAYTAAQRVTAADTIVTRLGGMPGVEKAAFANAIPFTNGEALSSFPVKTHAGGYVQVQSGVRSVSPGYFAALGQKLVSGREFTAADTAASQTVVIVNREFARKYLDGRALGWGLPTTNKDRSITDFGRPIVGVVENTARHDVTDTPEPEIYLSTAQQPFSSDTVNLVVRSASDPRGTVAALRSIVHDAAPDAPVEQVMTMRDRVADSLARPRLYAVLLATFAAFALAIAGVGLFGVLSYTVAQRAREIGVRTALGAQLHDIVGLVVRQAMAIAAAGVLIGLTVSVWAAGALRTYLYGVTTHDAASFIGVALTLMAVALLASIVPARRAASVDPVAVLRG